MAEITISLERFEELISTEREAKIIKALLKDKQKRYGEIKHSEIDTMCLMLGIEEENDG